MGRKRIRGAPPAEASTTGVSASRVSRHAPPCCRVGGRNRQRAGLNGAAQALATPGLLLGMGECWATAGAVVSGLPLGGAAEYGNRWGRLVGMGRGELAMR